MGLLEVLPGTSPPTPENLHNSENAVALFNPCGIAVSLAGQVFIADTGHHRICVLEDDVLRVLAGSGARGWADGKGLDAMFAHPCGLAIDPEGTLFVADCGNQRIRQIMPDGTVTTVAGSGTAAHRDGPGKYAAFYNPCGIAIDYINHDTLYVADYSNNCIRVVSRGGVVSTLGKDSAVPLDSPYGIAVHLETSSAGETEARVYVSSYHSHSLAAVHPDGTVQILAGCGAARKADGKGEAAAFHAPNGLCVDSDGVLYVADSGNHCLRRVTPDGEVSTLAGDGVASLGAEHLNSPCGVCVCVMPGHGPSLLIADRSNSCVRRLTTEALPPPSVAPSTIRKDLSTLLDAETDLFGDGEAIFEVEGRRLRAPKALLCVRCPHFRAMFTSGMRESFENTVRIPDVGYDVFRALLCYLLTDELSADLPVGALLEIMMLSNAYGVMRLEQLCARRVAAALSEHNACDAFRCAELIGECHLLRAAEKFSPDAISYRPGSTMAC